MKIKAINVKDIKFPEIELKKYYNNCLMTGPEKYDLITINCKKIKCDNCAFNRENYQFLRSLNEE